MNVTVCDLCGEEIKYLGCFHNPLKVKVKRHYIGFDESGYEKIDICSFCADEIIKASKKRYTDFRNTFKIRNKEK